jgi:hypothetical protein
MENEGFAKLCTFFAPLREKSIGSFNIRYFYTYAAPEIHTKCSGPWPGFGGFAFFSIG